ncbi:MAG TPA: NUDIX hydrolase [Patescibacteria group bacterium]|nr:NUDIX hydrolase [Patescibacteria group bacterium]
MRKAARAIIIEDGKILVMHRNKYGSKYFTLVGGRMNDDETPEQALVREIKEETGLQITAAQLVFIEEHQAPSNEQYIYLCEVAPHAEVAIQDTSEEGIMNTYDMNIHQPCWVGTRVFSTIPFRTPQLQDAIAKALKKGFPKQAIKL